MWRKSAFINVHRLSANNRWIGHIAPPANVSYLQNPGSEPLRNVTLGDVIAESVNKYPNRVAVKSVHENVTLTYEELLKQADSFGCALRAKGLEKGDRLGIWAHNSASWIVAVVAAARAGLISVLINPAYEPKELSFCIKKTGIKSLLIGERIANRDYYRSLETMLPELQDTKAGVLTSQEFPTLNSIIQCGKEKTKGTVAFDELISEYSSGSQISKYGAEVNMNDGNIIHFTSGTTGDPKAALDSHVGVANNTYFIGKRLMLNEDHQTICVQVPLFHALGSIVTILGGLRHGSSLVLASPTYNITANINTLLAEKCTVITGTPTMFVDMLSQIRTMPDVSSHLKVACAAGAPCSPQLIKNMQKYLKTKHVNALYGMTEATASIFQSKPEDSTDLVAESVGYIQDHVETKVVDDNGQIVPFGSPGELVVRGYNNMLRYWDEPKKTREALDEDGWLRTGDKFTISEDGYGRIVGRLKDIVVRGGENIAPKEIEDLLNTHPDVIESQVVGVPDERLGEELCAVVRVREGTAFTLAEMTRFCTGHIARFKIPRILKQTQEFPKTQSGKIQKFKLKEQIESGKL